MLRLIALIIVLGVIAGLAAGERTQAAAPRGSIQRMGNVLKKLDPSQPPSYPNEFFMPPPAPLTPGGRELLMDDVADVLRLAAASTTSGWCDGGDGYGGVLGILEIRDLAAGTSRYFDITRTSNPALGDFMKDWLKVAQAAGCAP